ncbi:MAG: UxaA family hydrolase [Acutalibacter sp.]|jgi:altronate hydrolase
MITRKIHPKDNVAVSLDGSDTIPAGHKFALVPIQKGEFVIKYGEIIGRATRDIQPGEWVHTHNLRSHLDEDASYHYHYEDCSLPPQDGGYFLGYPRSWGRAGIRNEIYILPTVGCVNPICQELERQAQDLVRGSIDGIFALTHQFGCSQLGQDGENIRELLCSIALNPNASCVLIVGLGCENNSLQGIRDTLSPLRQEGVAYLNCQEAEDELAAGMDRLREFASHAKDLKRQPVPLSQLCVGLKCGGSDGYSGLTANPLVGQVTDRIIASGGSAVLTEVPEMFGAEQLLMNRCRDQRVFEAYRDLILRFKRYYTDNGFPVYENPSPGNKAGGITTLEEKSLGCVKKGGSSPIVDVLPYGGRVAKTGLTALEGPGNDLISSTALGAAGCQLVLFTTGRGTPFATFVPTMKIATNTPLAQRKSRWIDFDAYPGDADALYRLVVDAASGIYRCKSETQREIAFHKTGVTL